MWTPDFVEADRIDRALRAPHTFHARVELWSDGHRITKSAPYTDGTVTDAYGSDNLGIGVRRTLSLTVIPTRAWLRWLELPALEVRPYTGLWLGKSTLVECPQGRFPILPPEMNRPAETIKFQAFDYYQRVKSAQFTEPVMTPPWATRTKYVIWWLLRSAGLPVPNVKSTSEHPTVPTLFDKADRHAAVVDAAKAIAAEVYMDREGVPTIADARLLGEPTSDITGLVETVKRTPQWDNVYNIVSASTTNRDVPHFDPYQVAITLRSNPAHPTRLGTNEYPDFRVYLYSSPLLMDWGQAADAAWRILAKVSALAVIHQFSGIPDPRIDAGDTIIGPSPTGLVAWPLSLDQDNNLTEDLQKLQVASVTHPLTHTGKQQITTAGSAVPV